MTIIPCVYTAMVMCIEMICRLKHTPTFSHIPISTLLYYAVTRISLFILINELLDCIFNNPSFPSIYDLIMYISTTQMSWIRIPLYLIMYDCIVFIMHHIEHMKSAFICHKLHHSVFATHPLEGFYMSWPNFIIEFIIPYLIVKSIGSDNPIDLFVVGIMGYMANPIMHTKPLMTTFHTLHHDPKDRNPHFSFSGLPDVTCTAIKWIAS